MTGPPAPVSREQLLAGTPPDRAAETAGVAREVARSGRRLVVLDDDPTGTQTVAGLPVLTRWAEDDLRWAFGQQVAAFFVLTNSRSLAPGRWPGSTARSSPRWRRPPGPAAMAS